jgi:hypothetical protein
MTFMRTSRPNRSSRFLRLCAEVSIPSQDLNGPIVACASRSVPRHRSSPSKVHHHSALTCKIPTQPYTLGNPHWLYVTALTHAHISLHLITTITVLFVLPCNHGHGCNLYYQTTAWALVRLNPKQYNTTCKPTPQATSATQRQHCRQVQHW